jgi:hypothetical protein
MRGLPFGVRRVTVLRRGPYDETWDQIVYEDNRPKPISKRLKRAERVVRRIAKVNANVAVLYLDEHDKSNRRKRDGWLYDFRRNIRRAREDADDRREVLALPDSRRDDRPRVIARYSRRSSEE